MLTLHVLYLFVCGLFIPPWVTHGRQQTEDPTVAEDLDTINSTETEVGLDIKNASTVSHHGPSFLDDMFASLHNVLGNDSDLTGIKLTRCGICASFDNLSSSALLELAEESRNNRKVLKIMYPTRVRLVEEDKSGIIRMSFHPPQSLFFKMKAVLLLMFESPFKGGEMDVTCISQSLQPNKQSVCISGDTQYILMPGKASWINSHLKWTILIKTKSSAIKQSLKGSLISRTPILLLTELPGNKRYSVTHSPTTNSFFCALQNLLGDLLPQNQPEFFPFQLKSIESSSSQIIDAFSSEHLMARLINSSDFPVFLYVEQCPTSLEQNGQLSLSTVLLLELKKKLEQTLNLIQDIIKRLPFGHRVTMRLKQLKDLSAFPEKIPASGQRQYRAFFLLKALQTVSRTYELQRGQRATRAAPSNPVADNKCQLRDLTVSLPHYIASPSIANIKNCEGSCKFPLINGNTHAVLLNSLRETGVDVRGPCCVPLEYEPMQVVDIGKNGAFLITYDIVAKTCGCR